MGSRNSPAGMSNPLISHSSDNYEPCAFQLLDLRHLLPMSEEERWIG